MATDTHPTITTDMEELESLRLETLNHRMDNHRRRVVDPMQLQAQRNLDASIEALKQSHQSNLQAATKAALESDADFVASRSEQVKCINTLIEKYTDELPDGYAVTVLNPETQTLTGEYNPAARGLPIDTP